MSNRSPDMDDAPQRTIVLNVCFLAIFIDGAAMPATAGAVAQMTHAFALPPDPEKTLSTVLPREDPR